MSVVPGENPFKEEGAKHHLFGRHQDTNLFAAAEQDMDVVDTFKQDTNMFSDDANLFKQQQQQQQDMNLFQHDNLFFMAAADERARPRPTNGKRPPPPPPPADEFDEEDEDFGPETDVDAVDDVLLLSPTFVKDKQHAHHTTDDNEEKEQDLDLGYGKEIDKETPTPPADSGKYILDIKNNYLLTDQCTLHPIGRMLKVFFLLKLRYLQNVQFECINGVLSHGKTLVLVT